MGRSNEIGATAGAELKKVKDAISRGSDFRTEPPSAIDRQRFDNAVQELHQCQKQEESVKRRKSAAAKVMNALAGAYRHPDEVFVRYLERDGSLLFRKKGNNGKAHG